MADFLGIEIGGTKLQIVVADEDAVVRERVRFAIAPEEGAPRIRQHITETIQRFSTNAFRAVGVGFGGPVNRVTGSIWTSYHVSGWSGFPIVRWLQELTGSHTVVENDANAAALAEAVHGAGKNFENVFYVTLGSGVGGGWVLGKQIYHGAVPGETELGHVRLDKSGRTVQDSCSGWAVDEKIRKAAQKDPGGILAEMTRGSYRGEAKILSSAIDAGDKDASAIFQETVDDLCFALSHVVHLIHPETIILGGGLSLLGERLQTAVGEGMQKYIMDAFRPGPSVQLSALKEDVVPVGAISLAVRSIK